MDNYRHCAAVLRERDRDRYLADLFAPAEERPHLFALHAFATEVARVSHIASDPIIGEIRLQWWRDAIAAGDGAGNPVASALVETVRAYDLPLAALEMVIEAHVQELDHDGLVAMADLEAYAGGSRSSLLQLAAIVLARGRHPESAAAAGHGGVALALTAVVGAFATDAASGRQALPDDLLEAHHIDPASVAGRAQPVQVRAALADLRAIARRHLEEARAALAALQPVVRPAFLPLALVGPRLDRLEKAQNSDPFAPVPDLAPWRRQWILWREARR